MALFRKRPAPQLEPEFQGVPLAALPLRTPVMACGKVSRMKTRPALGMPALVVTLRDDSGFVTAIWTGRRAIGGIELGRTLCLEGVATASRDGVVFMNPAYTLR